MGASIIVWIILILLPLFPVISLYKLFQDQSFFELSGVVKGLVASGPVAAYAVFVYVGWKIFDQVFRQRAVEQRLSDCRNDLARANSAVEQLTTQNNELSQMLFGITPSKQIADQLVGRWDFTSQSSVHQRVLTGDTRIQFNNGVLRLNGNFQENRNPIGEWTSEAAQVVDSSVLVIVYNMREFKNGDYQQHRGVCTFQLSAPPITEMTGFWVVVGRTEMYGTVEYKKRATA